MSANTKSGDCKQTPTEKLTDDAYDSQKARINPSSRFVISRTMATNFTIVSNGQEYKVSFHQLGVSCGLFENADLLKKGRYETRGKYTASVMNNFIAYAQVVGNDRKKAVSLIQPGCYDGLLQLADEFKNTKLKEDVIQDRNKECTTRLKFLVSVRAKGNPTEKDMKDAEESANFLAVRIDTAMQLMIERDELTLPFSPVDGIVNMAVNEKKKKPNPGLLCDLLLKLMQREAQAIGLLKYLDITDLSEQQAKKLLANADARKYFSSHFDVSSFVDLVAKVSRLRKDFQDFERTANAKMDSLRQSAMQLQSGKPQRAVGKPVTPMDKLKARSFYLTVKPRENVVAWFQAHEAAAGQRFVLFTSQNRDCYALMTPGGQFFAFLEWLTLKFMGPVAINGVRIQSGDQLHPKDFAVIFMNGATEVHRQNFSNEKRLSTNSGVAEEKFKTIVATDVRFEVKGNWKDGGRRTRLLNLDFFSPDLPSGQTLFQYYMSRVGPGPSERQKYVEIHEKEGNDGRTLANPGSTFIFWTYSGGTWVQYSFTQGALLLTGYKMKTKDLRKWKLIATNNEAAKMEDWCVLHEGEIDKQDEHALRKYTVTSPAPFKFFRLVTKEKGFNDDTNVVLSYFDLDGVFFPN